MQERECFSSQETAILDQEKIFLITWSKAYTFPLEDTGIQKEPRVVANSTADWGPQLWSPENLIGRKLDFKTRTLHLAKRLT